MTSSPIPPSVLLLCLPCVIVLHNRSPLAPIWWLINNFLSWHPFRWHFYGQLRAILRKHCVTQVQGFYNLIKNIMIYILFSCNLLIKINNSLTPLWLLCFMYGHFCTILTQFYSLLLDLSTLRLQYNYVIGTFCIKVWSKKIL